MKSHAERKEGHQLPATVHTQAAHLKCKVNAILKPGRYNETYMQRHHVGQEQGPQIVPRTANDAYPPISPADPCSLGPVFGGQLCRIPAQRNARLQTFPWQKEQCWVEGQDQKDFQVPCHQAPDTEGGTIVVMSGFCGGPRSLPAKRHMDYIQVYLACKHCRLQTFYFVGQT